MSDSRHKENVEAGKAPKPVSAQPAINPQKGRKPGTPEKQTEPGGKTWPIWLLSALVVLALAGFVWILASQLFLNPQVREANQETRTTSAEEGSAPLSIIPEESTGVTILEKQPETGNEGQATGLAPVAQGADIASGFAMDLGAADSFLELSRRFAAIADLNGPENFQRLEPRAVLRDTVNGLEAHLLVGPFETQKEASEACAILVLDEAMPCGTATFEGELIPRN